MENIYAAMLLHKAGKEINEESVTNVLKAAGLEVDVVKIKALVASLSEVNIDEAIEAAPTMMAAAPVAAPAAGEQKPAAAAPEDLAAGPPAYEYLLFRLGNIEPLAVHLLGRKLYVCG